MTTFSYGDFVFQVIDRKTRRIGNVTTWTTDTSYFANGVLQRFSYQGQAIIPEIAIDESTKRKYKVIETSNFCFKGCTQVKEVYLPQTLKQIGIDSFFDTAITTLIIPKSVTKLREYCLSHMLSLSSLIFEPGSKLETIEKNILCFSNSLKRVVFPPSLKSISEKIFIDSTSSSIEFIYCGKNILSESTALTSPSTVKAYVTKLYPKDTQIGGITPSIINDNSCSPYDYYHTLPQCTRQKRRHDNSKMSIFFYLILIYSS